METLVEIRRQEISGHSYGKFVFMRSILKSSEPIYPFPPHTVLIGLNHLETANEEEKMHHLLHEKLGL